MLSSTKVKTREDEANRIGTEIDAMLTGEGCTAAMTTFLTLFLDVGSHF